MENNWTIGDIGEAAIDRFLTGASNIQNFYKPMLNKSHPVDRLIVTTDGKMYYGEIKTKPAYNGHASGFDIKHYEVYKSLNLPVFVFFVDSNEGMIYGNWLTELEQPIMESGRTYPIRMRKEKIILFPRSRMFNIHKLDEHTISVLKKLEKPRSYIT